jgi:hypothetical protein
LFVFMSTLWICIGITLFMQRGGKTPLSCEWALRLDGANFLRTPAGDPWEWQVVLALYP